MSDFKVIQEPNQFQFEELECWLLQEEQETGDGFYSSFHLLKDSFEKGKMVLAVLQGKIIGFLTWRQNSEFGVYINYIEIKPDLQGLGLGRKLLKVMFEFFRTEGFYTVDLKCAPAGSEGFWKKMGFLEFPESSLGWNIQGGRHKRLYRKLIDTLEQLSTSSADDEFFELWNDDTHLMQDATPSWIWKLEFKNGKRELVKPIVHPAAPGWRARWRKGDEVFKDGPVKRLLPCENTTGSFVMITTI